MSAKLSPLFQQYHGIKNQHQDKLLLFRMGDFFELFYEDATKVANLLGLTLTKRNNQGTEIPMAGVPAQSIQQYLARLVRLGESVAVCDQVGEAVAGGGIIERQVTQVVTPGTLTDAGLLAERDSCIAMAITEGLGKAGYAWLELASARLVVGECEIEQLVNQVARIRPQEILIAEDANLPHGISAAVKQLPAWEFDSERGESRLLSKFKVSDLAGFGLENMNLAVAAASALVGYAEHTQCQAMGEVLRIRAEYPNQWLHLAPITRASLELTASLGGTGPCLLTTIDHCVTAMGGRLLRQRLHHPLIDHQQLEQRQDAWQALLCLNCQQPISAKLQPICDLERISARIALGSVRPRELVGLRELLIALPQLASELTQLPVEVAKRYQSINLDYTQIANLLQQTLLEEPAPTLREGGVINPLADPELARLRQIAGDSKSVLAEIERNEKQRTGLSSLRIGNNSVHGYYFELPRSQAELAPPEYRRRQTLKHAERYQTDELIKIENEISSAFERALSIERRIYAELVEQLASSVASLQQLSSALADLDLTAAMAQLASSEKWSRPQYTKQPQIEIKQGFHPVVKAQLDYFESNDTSLTNDNRLMVLTGPNMGGKSTYMRQVALIALLAHIGAPVPAAAALIGGLTAIHTRIGATDDLAGGRSTFMIEMLETAAILNTADEGSLVLLDEIGRGTSTYDGLALAWSAAETLLNDNRSMVLLATHYFELTELANLYPEVNNHHMQVNEHQNQVVMLHKLAPGPASRSFGLQVAKMAGVPAATIQAASKKLTKLQATATSAQLPLLETKPTIRPVNQQHKKVISRLLEVNLDEMSPREAQQFLYELSQLAHTVKLDV